MEASNEGHHSKGQRKVFKTGLNAAAAGPKTAGKKGGQKIRDTNGRQLTPAEVRRYKKRITNRESARKMRQQRKDEWVVLNKEANALREENDALRQKSRSQSEAYAKLLACIQRMQAAKHNLLAEYHEAESVLLHLSSMPQEKVEQHSDVPAGRGCKGMSMSPEEYNGEEGVFNYQGSDDSQAEDADMEDCKDADLVNYTPSDSGGRGASVKPEMSPPCASIPSVDCKVMPFSTRLGGNVSNVAGGSPSPPATPPTEPAPVRKGTPPGPLPPLVDMFNPETMQPIPYPPVMMRSQLHNMHNMPAGALQPRGCSVEALDAYNKHYATGMHSVALLEPPPNMLDPAPETYPVGGIGGIFDDLIDDFLLQPLHIDVNHPLPLLQQA